MKQVLLLSLLACWPTIAKAEFDPRDWKYLRVIQPSSEPSSGYLSLSLDLPVFDTSSPALTDLRIIDEGNTEVPYKIVISRSQIQTVQVPSKILDIGHTSDMTTFVVDVGGRFRSHNRVTIRTASKNFRRLVQVEASDDMRSWMIIRKDAIVFEVTSDYKVAHLSVDYPTSTRRYLRLSILGEGLAPLEIQGADLCQQVATAIAESTWTVASASRREEAKMSVWDVDMGYDNVPVSKIVFITPDTNFQRPARIVVIDKSPEGNEVRNTLASGVIWRFGLPNFSGEEISIPAAEFRARRFRVEVDNGDNPSLNIMQIAFLGPNHTVYFPANRRWPYRLYTGKKDAASPVYDMAAFAGYLDFTQVPRVTFVDPAMRPNPAYREVDKRPWTEQHKVLFWMFLLGLCGFMVFIIAQKTREILQGQ